MSEAAEPEAARLAEYLERVAGGEALEQVLAGAEDELQDLVRLAHQMAILAPSSPTPSFRARLQAQLQATDPPRRRVPWLRLVTSTVAVVIAVGLALGSMIVASADSTPGQPLYGVKRLTERTRLLLTRDPAVQAMLQLEYAERRVAEMRQLLDAGMALPPSLVDALLDSGAEALRLARENDAQLVTSTEQRLHGLGQAVSQLVQVAGPGDRVILMEAARILAPPTVVAPSPARLPSSPTPTMAPSPSPSLTMTPAAMPATPSRAVEFVVPTAGAQTPQPPATESRGPSPTVQSIGVAGTEASATQSSASPTAEEPTRPAGTSAASGNIRATELARETARAAEPRPTPTPWWPWWRPTPPPTAVPTGGAGQGGPPPLTPEPSVEP